MEKKRMFKVVIFLLFCLVVFCNGETAKEAHDKQLACIKACAREPSVLRCERSCSKSSPPPPHHAPKRAPPRHAPNPASQFKVGRTRVKPATTLVKGRRVVLIRKH